MSKTKAFLTTYWQYSCFSGKCKIFEKEVALIWQMSGECEGQQGRHANKLMGIWLLSKNGL